MSRSKTPLTGQHPESLSFSVHPSSATSLNASVALKPTLKNPHHSSFHLRLIPVMQHQDFLPSLDEVAVSDKSDPSRLPSYREARRFRFHPYSRPIPVLVNEEDRLLVKFSSFSFVFTDCTIIQNTIFDDECVVLNVPPLPAHLVVTVEFIHFYSDLVFKPNSIAPTSATTC